MPEERICPACGRSNPLTVRTCSNCAASFAGGGSGTVLLAQPPPPATSVSAYASTAELPTVQDGSWHSVSTRPGNIPLPPQIQAEARRREMEWERRSAEQRSAAARRAEVERRLIEEKNQREANPSATTQHALPSPTTNATEVVHQKVCTRCATPSEEVAGSTFSFCLKCGADLAETAFAAGSGPRSEPRSYRESMLERRARHRQQRLAAMEESSQGTGQTKNTTVPPSSEHAGSSHTSSSATRKVVVTVGGTAAQQQQNSNTVSPGVAALGSFLLPGAGQVLNGQIAKGILVLFALWLATAAFDLSGLGLTLLLARTLMALDAYRIAERRRRGGRVRTWEWSIQ